MARLAACASARPPSVMFALFLLADLTAGWLHVAASDRVRLRGGQRGRRRARPGGEDLLLVATTPPLIFLLAVSCQAS